VGRPTARTQEQRRRADVLHSRAAEISKMDETKKSAPVVESAQDSEVVVAVDHGVVVNASGHKDQLRRQYGLLELAGVALTVDNAWAALGSSISVSIRKSCGLMARRYRELD
jgi:hypothetical protein